MTVAQEHIAIVGAGPIGLEAALQAVHCGFSVQVYERGCIAENVLAWGHVRLFSPFGMNASPLGLRRLQEVFPDYVPPASDALLTGREYAEAYLLPLSRLPELESAIHERHAIRAIGRRTLSKRSLVGRPERRDDPFVLSFVYGQQQFGRAEASAVLDCSGTYPHHNWLGAGGTPCPAESEILSPEHYMLPDVLGADRDRFAGRRTLVVGAGYSAATTVVALHELSQQAPGTEIVWLTRATRHPPLVAVEQDALPECANLIESASRLVSGENPPVLLLTGQHILSVSPLPRGGWLVAMEDADYRMEPLEVDEIVALVGYRPDRALYEELQVQECHASQGPMKLAAALLGYASGDCLSQQNFDAETLRTTEPGFFILGAKSYGRDSRFLIQQGLRQVQDVLSLLQAPAALGAD